LPVQVSIPDRLVADARGFSLIEMMIATLVLMVVCGTVMKGVLDLTNLSQTITNRTDMHNGVRNATELLTQEVGQAGRIALPAPVALANTTVAGTTTLAVGATAGMFIGEQLMIGTDNSQETVTVTAIPGDTTVDVTALTFDHPAGTPVRAPGGFAAGVVPPNAPNGSTGTRLKIFGDIHDDGNMVYVEYWCDLNSGRLYRISLPASTANKLAPTVDQVLIDNIEANPDGTACFTYQTEVVVNRTYVTGVAITLTVRTQRRDRNTGDFQRETKALLNVSPRNVFNVWQMASLNIDNRIQATPQWVTNLLPDPQTTDGPGYEIAQ
jgi:prepilin-type N-terminal cleavage/methylation domain-containing protein